MDVVAVPISAVGTRYKGSDKSIEEKKKEQEGEEEENNVLAGGDELEEVVFIIKPDNTVEKRVITTGIQDMNYYEVLTGLKEGELVVTAPYDAVTTGLVNGAKIKIVEKEALY